MNIAYQVVGDGPFDLVHVPPFVSNLELQWEHPDERRYFERLASFSRLIMFDKRGTGLSDRVAVATLEERMDDLRAVMDAAGSQRDVVFGSSEGGALSILFAATYPEHVSALVLYGAYAWFAWAPDYPDGVPDEVGDDGLPRVENTCARGDGGTPSSTHLPRRWPTIWCSSKPMGDGSASRQAREGRCGPADDSRPRCAPPPDCDSGADARLAPDGRPHARRG